MPSTRTVTGKYLKSDGSAWASATGTITLLSENAIWGDSLLKQDIAAVSDGSGDVSVAIPVPDSDAWAWIWKLPDGQTFRFALDAGAATTIAALQAAESTTTTADEITNLIAAKADKDNDAVADNLAKMNGSGNAVDAGVAFSAVVTHTKLTAGGANQSATIQAAITAAGTGDKIVLDCGDGAALVSSSLTVSDDITIEIRNGSLNYTDSGNPVFTVSAGGLRLVGAVVTGSTVEPLVKVASTASIDRLIVEGARTTCHGIQVEGRITKLFHIKDCEFGDGSTGDCNISLNGLHSSGAIQNGWVENVVIRRSGLTGNCVSVSNLVNDITFTNVDTYGGSIGFDMDDGLRCNLIQCNAYDFASTGFVLKPGSGRTDSEVMRGNRLAFLFAKSGEIGALGFDYRVHTPLLYSGVETCTSGVNSSSSPHGGALIGCWFESVAGNSVYVLSGDGFKIHNCRFKDANLPIRIDGSPPNIDIGWNTFDTWTDNQAIQFFIGTAAGAKIHDNTVIAGNNSFVRNNSNINYAADNTLPVGVDLNHSGSGANLFDRSIGGASLPTNGQALVYNATNDRWEPGTAGVSDHGALSGLGDDDHTQYHRTDGSRPMTGQLSFTGTAHAGIVLIPLTTTQRDALTLAEGMVIRNSTANQIQGYVNGAWVDLGASGAASDHGSLSGLTDDDHTQYALADGSRNFTSTVTIVADGTNDAEILKSYGNSDGVLTSYQRADSIEIGTMENIGDLRLRTLAGKGLQLRSATKLTLDSDNGTIDTNAVINFDGTMGNSAQDPTTDAPTDWVEIKIGGTTYYLPAYTA